MLRFNTLVLSILLAVSPLSASVDFSGDTGDRISLGNLNHSNLSCSAWINIDDLTADQRAVIYAWDGSSGSTTEFAFRIESDGKIRLFTDNLSTTGLTLSNSSNVVSINTWTHVGFRYVDATPTCELFLNGAEVTGYDDTSCADIQASTISWTIGNSGTGSQQDEMNGEIDEIACWTANITDHQWLQLGTSRVKGMPLQIQPSNLLFYLPLDQGVGGTAVSTSASFYRDLGRNGNHGTATDANGNTINTSEAVLSYP